MPPRFSTVELVLLASGILHLIAGGLWTYDGLGGIWSAGWTAALAERLLIVGCGLATVVLAWFLLRRKAWAWAMLLVWDVIWIALAALVLLRGPSRNALLFVAAYTFLALLLLIGKRGLRR